MSDDFIRYAQPLIGSDWPAVPLVGGLPRYARFQPIFADQTLPAYVPETYR